MNKATMRRLMGQARIGLSDAQYDEMSRHIAERVLEHMTTNERRIHVYASRPELKEVATEPLIRLLRAALPISTIVVGDPSPQASQPKGTFDVVIVPLLAFDDDLARVGFGGGWYDRFLAAQPSARKIGLAYDFQHVDDAKSEPHDIALDLIVTQSRVFTK